MRRTARALLVVPVILLTMTACGDDDDNASGAGGNSSSDGTSTEASTDDPEEAPAEDSRGLAPTTPEGEQFFPMEGLSITLPAGTTEEDTQQGEGPTTAVYRFPDADEQTGLPAVQVEGGAPFERSLLEETWTQEQLLRGAGVNSEVARTVEEWPGAAEAVALTWSQEVENAEGGSHTNDVLQLWLTNESGTGFSVMAVAPEGDLEPGSAAYDSVLSTTLE